MTPLLWKRALSELIATSVVTFVAAGAVCTDQYSGGELGLLGIAMAYALSHAVMLSATLQISGGHLNPAVTLAAWMTRKIKASEAAIYVLSQLVGATMAAVMLRRTFSVEIWHPVSLGAPTLSVGVSVMTGAFVEAALTFLLVLTALQVVFPEREFRPSAGFSVGAALLCGILLGGPLTGAALNPARAFGPALVSGSWSNHWLYWIGPLVGAILGTVAYSALRTDTSRTPAH